MKSLCYNELRLRGALLHKRKQTQSNFKVNNTQQHNFVFLFHSLFEEMSAYNFLKTKSGKERQSYAAEYC